MGIIKMIYNKNIYIRLVSLLLGVVFVILLSGCDEVVIEPVPTIELHSGYNVQLTSLSKNVTWESNNPSVATVSSTGLVTAVSAGKATIYTHSSKEQQEVACYLEVHPKRNILFYIGGDSNLSNEAYEKINKIRSGWQPGKGEMIIYVDHKEDGACLLRISDVKGSNNYFRFDTIQYYGKENSADHAVVSRVINKMKQDYPADSYGMIFFSHASGWLPEGMLAQPRSLVIDDGGSVRHEMEYYDFAAAIPDKQFDFIILEACLMADVISMYELRNKTKYVLASSAEIVSPGFTYIYEKEIMGLYDTKNHVSSVLTGFAQAYYDSITTRYKVNDDNCSTTMSIIKMDEMESLASVTKTTLQGISIDETSLTISDIQTFDRPYGLISGAQKKSRYFDLADVLENLVPETRYNSFIDRMEKTVIWKASTERFLLGDNGFYIKRHCGLSTYIEQDAYPFLNSVYRNSSWYKAIY